MKHLVIFALLAAASARPEEAFYSSKYDSYDVTELVSNTRLLKAFTHCLLGDAKCTPDGTTIKKWLPEAVQTDCTKCTEKQRSLAATVAKAIIDQLPQQWEMLAKTYDSEGKHTDSFNKFIEKYAL
uniref:Chemosensory protein CSP18 n=1 Tax=Carposina sasakii TaxID=252295 RepID=A0A9E8LCU9_CARSA|nr:chemosensory protein CSP18 [Carposina sasakii]